jgi:hypothetical protein
LQQLTGDTDLSGELAQGDSFFTGTGDDGKAEVAAIALEKRKSLVDDVSGLEGPALPERRSDWLALFKSLDRSTEDSLSGPQVLAGPAAGFDDQFELPNDCIAMGRHSENRLFTSGARGPPSSAPKPGPRPPDETESMPGPGPQVGGHRSSGSRARTFNRTDRAQSERDSDSLYGSAPRLGFCSRSLDPERGGESSGMSVLEGAPIGLGTGVDRAAEMLTEVASCTEAALLGHGLD